MAFGFILFGIWMIVCLTRRFICFLSQNVNYEVILSSQLWLKKKKLIDLYHLFCHLLKVVSLSVKCNPWHFFHLDIGFVLCALCLNLLLHVKQSSIRWYPCQYSRSHEVKDLCAFKRFFCSKAPSYYFSDAEQWVIGGSYSQPFYSNSVSWSGNDFILELFYRSLSLNKWRIRPVWNR